MDLLSLKGIAGGALQEKVNVAVQSILDNMQDPNTPWKVKRKIFITLSFSQNEDRDDAEVEMSVSTKPAPVSPITTRMAIGRDLRSGEIYAEEYGKQIKGQMSLDLGTPQEKLQQIDGHTVDTETGEIVETDNKVINLRKAAL